jgi:Co/Zn/Cd efflux system component
MINPDTLGAVAFGFILGVVVCVVVLCAVYRLCAAPLTPEQQEEANRLRKEW